MTKTNIDKPIYLAKNDPVIDLSISIDEFLRTAPKGLLKTFLNSGGPVKENSYAQLIDDYDAGIEVIEIDGKKESLTAYILRHGGVSE